MSEVGEQHSEDIKTIINHLEESAKRQGRIDWKNIVVGTLFTLAIEYSLSPENARFLITLALGLFHSVIGGLHMIL